MSRRRLFAVLVLSFSVGNLGTAQASKVVSVPGDPVVGKGDVSRTLLTYSELFSDVSPSSPVGDNAFALPANAAMPKEEFEGRLELVHPESSGGFAKVFDYLNLTGDADSPWKHLPTFSFEFVQNGSYLIPARQGLIFTGDPSWNYIIGPGRVWSENGDSGYTRASFPFALVERSQNCVHNGEMMFLFSNTKPARISKVRYQITQETCFYHEIRYVGAALGDVHSLQSGELGTELKNDEAAEIAQTNSARRPFDRTRHGLSLGPAWTWPASSKPSNFPERHHGLRTCHINGRQLRERLPRRATGSTRSAMRCGFPSYSTAKSAFASVAMMRLGQLYGSTTYSPADSRLICHNRCSRRRLEQSHLRQHSGHGHRQLHQERVSIADEDGPEEDCVPAGRGLRQENRRRLRSISRTSADPGTTWVYQSQCDFSCDPGDDGLSPETEGRGRSLQLWCATACTNQFT
jgi:hypothetical protein